MHNSVSYSTFLTSFDVIRLLDLKLEKYLNILYHQLSLSSRIYGIATQSDNQTLSNVNIKNHISNSFYGIIISHDFIVVAGEI